MQRELHLAFMSGGAAGGQARASPKAPDDAALDTTGAAGTLALTCTLVKHEHDSSDQDSQDEDIAVAKLYVQPRENAREKRVCMGSSVLDLKPGVDREMIQECARIVIHANRSRHQRVLGIHAFAFLYAAWLASTIMC